MLIVSRKAIAFAIFQCQHQLLTHHFLGAVGGQFQFSEAKRCKKRIEATYQVLQVGGESLTPAFLNLILILRPLLAVKESTVIIIPNTSNRYSFHSSNQIQQFHLLFFVKLLKNLNEPLRLMSATTFVDLNVEFGKTFYIQC